MDYQLGRTALRALVMATLAGPAFAQADPGISTWSGPYFGASLGFGEADIVSPSGQREELDGRVTTIHSGYSWTIGENVVGIEGDLSVNLGRDTAFGPKVEIDGERTGVDWFATLRGRYGRIMDGTLVYVTGGAAYSDTVSSDRSYALGVVYGGGFEQPLTFRWTLRTEILFMDFDDGDTSLSQTDSTWHVQFGLSRYW